jgi:hypothetical protein
VTCRGDVRVVSGEEDERDLTDLDAIALSERMLANPATVDDRPVAAPEID